MSAPDPGRLGRAAASGLSGRLRFIEGGLGEDARATMAREVRAGLLGDPRSIPPKYFYDERGSRLFDAICDLPEYYLTRSERALLARHAAAIVSALEATTLVEIGSGMARKTGLLVRAIERRADAPRYVPFDISRAPLEASARDLLAAFPRLEVRAVVGDFARDLHLLSHAAPESGGPRLFAFLGSTIGNLEEPAAVEFLRAIGAQMSPRDGFLLGVDRVKDGRVLDAAYNDAQGVTAAFNKNVLRVVSRALDGDFDEGCFDHRAHFAPDRERIEMHLVARRRHVVRLRAIDLSVPFAAGEPILTEISRKFTPAGVERLLTLGGMRLRDWFSDPEGSFGLALAVRA
ncbi:MAG: L-histidine N(alpha)-methyltransferase [Myxococcales bacterium]|nr:L-histidine N(alpha)-methyltransferase [Myxococcales bacterium]